MLLKKLLIIGFLFFVFYNAQAEYPDSVLIVKFTDGSRMYALSIDTTSSIMYSLIKLDSSKSILDSRYFAGVKKARFTPSMIPERAETYWETGLVFGLPTGLSWIFGRSMDPVSFHFSCFYAYYFYGIQFDFGYILAGNKKSYHSLSAVLGSTWLGENSPLANSGANRDYVKIQYFGPAYTYVYKSLWLQLGVGYSNVETRKDYFKREYLFIPLFQIGWISNF